MKKIIAFIKSLFSTPVFKPTETKFPITVEITQEILDKANVMDIRTCNGALTLRENTFGYDEIIWGVSTGNVYKNHRHTQLYSTTTDGKSVKMTDIKEPMTVVFTKEKPEDFNYYY